MPNSKRRIESAFTLIEALVAMAIFALAVTVLTQSFVNTLLSLDSIETESDTRSDIQFVRSFALKEPDRDKFEEGGDVTTLSSGEARWRGEIESTAVSDLFKVTLTIELSPPDGKGRETYTRQLYLLRPTWSDPVERSELIAENRDKLYADRLDRQQL